jgi:uncharacterized delta-60 repeat protein/uncharacterized repeat protein (TIGR01451 family)
VVALAGLLVWMAVMKTVAAAAGDLDSRFGNGGKQELDLFGGDDEAYAAAVQPDGKIVVVGGGYHGNYDFVLVRYNKNGSLDDGSTSDSTPGDSFGSAGKVVTDFSGGHDIATGVALQPGGKIVVAGASSKDGMSPSYESVYDFALARYNTDGSLDNGSTNDSTPGDSFGIDGKVTTDLGGSEIARALSMQPDGKLLIAGRTFDGSDSQFALARYNAGGSLDDNSTNDSTPGDSFGAGGHVITDLPGVSDQAFALVLQPDGKMVAVGESYLNKMGVALARYNSDGSLDDGASADLTPGDSFGSGGIVLTTSMESAAFDAVLQPDGKIVVAGYVNFSSYDFALARYNADGSLDDGTNGDSTPGDSFGSGGRVTTTLSSGMDIAQALTLQPDGKLVAAGFAYTAYGNDFALARYNSNGSPDDGSINDATPDDSFGTGGRVTTEVRNDDSATDVVLQPDGKIVAVGRSLGYTYDFALARYAGDRPEPPVSDLSITQTVSSDSALLGSQVSYTLEVKNYGPLDATGVVATDTLPGGVQFVSSADGCTHSSGVVSCTIDDLADGATTTRSFLVKINQTGKILNTASVTADQSDPLTENNTSAAAKLRGISLQRLTFSPPIVIGGGQNSTATILLTEAAPAGGAVINLLSGSAAVSVPSQVIVNAHERTATFEATTGTVNAEKIINVTASLPNTSVHVVGRVKLLPIRTASITFDQNPVQGRQHVAGTVTLTCAPDMDVVVRLTTNRAAARPDVSMVTIPAGQTSAQFGITTLAVPSSRDVIITAIANGGYQRATLYLTP